MATEEIGIRLSLKDRRQAAQGLKDTAKDVDNLGKASSRMGRVSKAGFAGLRKGLGFVAKVVKGGVLTAGAAAVGALAYSVTKGFARLSGIENATAKLDGLGHSGARVRKIMDNALASVRGTAFGMDEAASTAAGSVAAGVKPGRDLERTLKLVADAATIGGTSMGEMGAIFNKVATSNKVQGEVIAQLSDRGIPIVQLLAKELGLTGEQVLEMSKKGKIGFNDFRNAMERGMGGAALESGKTTTGALKNTQAAFGRFGAQLLSGAFPLVVPFLNEVMFAVDGLTARVEPLVAKFNKRFGPSLKGMIEGSGQGFLDWVDRMTAATGRLIDQYQSGGLKGVLAGLQLKGGDKTASAGKGIAGAFGAIAAAIGSVDWAAVKTNLGKGVSDTVSVFSVVIGFLADNVDKLARYMPQLVAAYMAYRFAQAAANVASLAAIPLQAMMLASQIAHTFALRANTAATVTNTVAENAGTAARSRGIVGLVAQKVAMVAVTGATKAMAVAQRILNLVLLANPIGLIIAAAGLLVVGFVMLYKKSETVRNGLRAMGRFGVMAFRFLLTAAFATFNGILTAAAKGLGWVPGLGSKIKAARTAFRDFGDATIAKLRGVEAKLRDTTAAADRLARNRTAEITINANYRGDAAAAARQQSRAIPRAAGGMVRPDRDYEVGERGRELFRPAVPGVILPRVPAPVDLTDLMPYDVTIGSRAGGGPLVVQVVMPDGRVLAETVLEELADAEARE